MAPRVIGLGGALLLVFAGCERGPDESTIRELITARTLGLAYLEENRFDEAEAEFLRVIELEPTEALGHANLGLVYLLVEDRPQAEQHISRALAITPDDPDARYLLAQVYLHTEREAEGRKELENTRRRSSEHVRTLYALAEIAVASGTESDRERRVQFLAAIVEVLPTNLRTRLQLVEALLHNGKADEAAMHLEEVRRLVAEFPGGANPHYADALRLMRASRAEQALAPTAALHRALQQTLPYAAGIADLLWQGLSRTGFPTFSRGFSLEARDEVAREQLAAIRFTDVTSAAGLDVLRGPGETASEMPEREAPLAVADYDGDGDVDLYAARWTANGAEAVGALLRNDSGRFVETTAESGLRRAGPETSAAFADYDNDGWLDLYVVTAGPNILYRNTGEGRFVDVTATTGVGDSAAGHAALFLDADHDGDLDLYVANPGRNRLYRNNMDGTFLEVAEAMGVAGGDADSRDAALGDFDNDGDLDLFVANRSAPSLLYTNLRQGRFRDIARESGVADAETAGAVAVGDYDNDGFLDLFVAALGAGQHRLYRNRGDGSFEPDTGSQELDRALSGVIGLDASFFDFDNDGFLDLVVAGRVAEGIGSGVFLFHNDGKGRFEDFSSILPQDLSAARRLAIADYENDGDLDLFLAGLDGGLRLLRNDGGNANRYLDVRLVGLRVGGGRSNHFGVGAKVEVRAGELYQMRIVTDPTTHFGLGSRVRADAVRVVWTNGVPQNAFKPRSDQTLVEKQVLKGSCPFLYAWDGQRFEFVTDIMWRSALGMPLGIMGVDSTYAPAAASQEYLRVPGRSLKEKEGSYILRLTEELWETAYVDEVKLIVVDHPDSIDVYVDERFVPPGPASLTVHQVADKRRPVAAADGKGNNLLPLIREEDDIYISNLEPTRYQGVTELHDLSLDLGDLPEAGAITLFLNGWIFPTDASVTVAIAQSRQDSVIPPYLQVVGADGRWRTAIENLGFPAGKKKTVIADLTGKFPTKDHRVRIRTNMEVSWDHVFFSIGGPSSPVRTTTLEPVSADLHYRGFSAEYRRGGRHGPHWFDYGQVSTEPRWLPLDGLFTRFGDVQPLLQDSDDRYVIMAPGDEVTIAFDARQAPSLASGWSRDFLLYTDGWLKDADLNTATGNTVLPLPFHGMSRYPYGSDASYPVDEDHQRYLRMYNTRRLATRTR